jgi:hypothetical protein
VRSIALLLAIARAANASERVARRDLRSELVELALEKSFATICAFTASRASPLQVVMA